MVASVSNEQQIAAFLTQKGLPPAAVAALLGNFQVESSFSPTSSNAREGAIGIAQWEGGRRTNLQKYAATVGGKETDLNVQLGYLWQELSGPYSSVLGRLRSATDPSAAAADVDAHFEVSSGSARQTREHDATSIYSQLANGGTGALSTATLTGISTGAQGVGSGIPIVPILSGSLPGIGILGGAVGGVGSGIVSSVAGPVMVWVVKLGFISLGGLLVVAGLYRASGANEKSGGVVGAAKSAAVLAA